MPPKRKVRHPSRAASTPSADVAERPVEETQTPLKNDVANTAIVPDSWTDEQETSLFKGMIRWKPVGPFSHTELPNVVIASAQPLVLVVLTSLIRHAQTLSNDRYLPAPPKSRIYFTSRRSYTNTVHMGKVEKSLQP